MSINITTLISGALGFTLALAWNNAVNKVINSAFPDISTTAAAVTYAIVVTILVIFIVLAITKVHKVVGINCPQSGSPLIDLHY